MHKINVDPLPCPHPLVCHFSLQTGDKVKVVSRVDADWVVGEVSGRKGMFPASFVDQVPKNLPQESSSKEKSESPSKSQPPLTTKKVKTRLYNTV